MGFPTPGIWDIFSFQLPLFLSICDINASVHCWLVVHYGDFKLKPEVVRPPHFEGPYPQLKRGQQHLGALVAVVRPFRYIYRRICSCLLGWCDAEASAEGTFFW